MSHVDISGASPSVRMSVGSLAAVGSQSATLAVEDRKQAGYYDGAKIVVNGETRTITSFGSNRVCTLDAPWANQPSAGAQYQIFHSTPNRYGRYWRISQADWWSAIGNGGGGQLRVEYDRSANNDWSDPVRMLDISARGGPGQNSNDAEMTIYPQVIRWVSNNSLRTPPRPQDGNILIPGEQHTGNDSSALDVGPEFSLLRDVFNPAPWSILGCISQGIRNSNDEQVIPINVYFRVRTAQAGNEDVELVIVPQKGNLQYVFGGEAGFAVESKIDGAQSPMWQRGTWSPGINGAPGYNWQSGLWYRSGDVCYAWGDVSITGAPSGSGAAVITGLPYAGASGPFMGVTFGQVDNLTMTAGYSHLAARINGQSINLIENSFGGGNANFLTHSALRSGTRLSFTAVYRVA